jgi:hypothetical protein
VSEDRDTASQDQAEPTDTGDSTAGSASAEDSTAGKASAGEQTYYRVNRLGREIFTGNKPILIAAIQTRRVRGDDLIFDEGTDTWGFARKHPVFLEATGQSIEDLERTRSSGSRWSRWIKLIANAALIGVILYFVISYSKTIEFRLGDGETEFKNFASQRKTKEKSVDSSEGAGAGEGDGEGDGYAEINALLQKEEEDSIKRGQEIEQIFDLNQEGVLENRILFEEGNTLSDMELLRRAQRVSSEMTERLNTNVPVGRAMYDRLQKAMAIASFVSQRNLTLKSKEHRGANTIISYLRTQLQRVCVAIYSDEFCKLKKDHPGWKDTVILSIVEREVLFGMSPEQVEAAWGRASSIKRERGGYRLCYGSGCERSVWVFEGHVREQGRPESAQRDKKSKRRKHRKKR